MEGFSLREVSAIAEVPETLIRTALEKRTVKPRARKVGKAVRYYFDSEDLLFIKLLAEFPFPLEKDRKATLHRLISRRGGDTGDWQLKGADIVLRSGDVTVLFQWKSVRGQLAKNLATYHWGMRRIVSDPDVLGGEPVFAGTRIPLEHIAGLMRKKIARKEIREDYPILTEKELDFAEIYSRIAPKPGRPRKKMLIKRFKKTHDL